MNTKQNNKKLNDCFWVKKKIPLEQRAARRHLWAEQSPKRTIVHTSVGDKISDG